jgi:glycosyltransferase involved in cell wall biosynthesis
MRICAIIPAYNNDRTISDVVREALRHVDRVFVVDDGSTDRTGSVAGEWGAAVIGLPENRGKGNALRVAFGHVVKSGFDAAVTLDADLQHDPAEIPKFIENYRVTGAKIVIGNRMAEKEKIPRVRFGSNRVAAVTFTWLIGQAVPDSQCGFRLYDREVLERFPILNEGFEAEADLLLRVGRRGGRISSIPIRTIYFPEQVGRSYFRPVHDTFRICIIFLMNLFWKNR